MLLEEGAPGIGEAACLAHAQTRAGARFDRRHGERKRPRTRTCSHTCVQAFVGARPYSYGLYSYGHHYMAGIRWGTAM